MVLAAGKAAAIIGNAHSQKRSIVQKFHVDSGCLGMARCIGYGFLTDAQQLRLNMLVQRAVSALYLKIYFGGRVPGGSRYGLGEARGKIFIPLRAKIPDRRAGVFNSL